MNFCQKCKSFCCKLGGTDFTKKEMQNVLNAGYINHFVKISENHYESKSKNGICMYLNQDNSCSIYELRPLACKSFPVYINFKDVITKFFKYSELSKDENNKTKTILIKCPLSSSLSKQELEIMENQAIKAKEILTKGFTCSKISKSDLKIIEKRIINFSKNHSNEL